MDARGPKLSGSERVDVGSLYPLSKHLKQIGDTELSDFAYALGAVEVTSMCSLWINSV